MLKDFYIAKAKSKYLYCSHCRKNIEHGEEGMIIQSYAEPKGKQAHIVHTWELHIECTLSWLKLRQKKNLNTIRKCKKENVRIKQFFENHGDKIIAEIL